MKNLILVLLYVIAIIQSVNVIAYDKIQVRHMEINELVKELSTYRTDDDRVYSVSPLWNAIENKDLETVKRLIDNGADVRALIDKQVMLEENFARDKQELVVQSVPPLYVALLDGDYETCVYLLRKGASYKNHNNNTALKYAIMSNDFNKVELILKLGVDVDDDGYGKRYNDTLSPLMKIAYVTKTGLLYHRDSFYDIKITKLLIKYGANICAYNEHKTALTRGLSNRNYEFVELLLDSGVDVEFRPYPRGNPEHPLDILEFNKKRYPGDFKVLERIESKMVASIRRGSKDSKCHDFTWSNAIEYFWSLIN